MPQPTVGQVHVDRLLTQFSVGYRNDTYIADRIFPVVPVQKQSDKYLVYTKGDWFRDEAQLRAPGAEPVASGYNVSSSNTYFCNQYAISKVVPDEVRANADEPFNVDREAVEFVTDRLMLRREVNWAANNFIASAWATSSTGGTADFQQWSNYGASDPTIDVMKYRNQVRGSIAKMPNKGVIGIAGLVQLMNHPVLVDRIKYTQSGFLNEQLIAQALGLEELLVGSAIQTATPEGLTTPVFTDVWGKSLLLAWVNKSPSLMSPSAGYTIIWQGIAGAPQFISRTRDERKRADFIDGFCNFDQKVVASDAGHMMTAIVA